MDIIPEQRKDGSLSDKEAVPAKEKNPEEVRQRRKTSNEETHNEAHQQTESEKDQEQNCSNQMLAPTPIYNCPRKRCKQIFKRKGDLLNHVKTHKVTHQCTYEGCGKSYSSKCNLDRHENDNHGMFTCSKCTFVSNLRESIKIHEIVEKDYHWVVTLV